MRTEKSVSKESLRRLWSEIALLRQEVEKAERDRVASQVGLTSAILAARPQPRTCRGEDSIDGFGRWINRKSRVTSGFHSKG